MRLVCVPMMTHRAHASFLSNGAEFRPLSQIKRSSSEIRPTYDCCVLPLSLNDVLRRALPLSGT